MGEGRQDGGGEVGRAGRRCCRRHRRLRSRRLWFFKLSSPERICSGVGSGGESKSTPYPFSASTLLLSDSLPLPPSSGGRAGPGSGGGWGEAATSPWLGASLAAPSAARPGVFGGTVPAAAPPRSLPPPVSAGPCGRRAWGSRAPRARCPGLETPRLSEESASADAGSGSAWVAPFGSAARPGSVRSRDPQKSELRSPSKVLVPRHCSGSGRECGERRDTAPTICWSPRCRGGGDGTWDTWGHLHASPSDEVNFAPSWLARLLDAKQASVEGLVGWGFACFESVWRNEHLKFPKPVYAGGFPVVV